MSVGDLVVFIDWDSSGGFGTPETHIGMIINIPESRCLPPIVDVMLPNEIITVHTDEVQHVQF